MPVPETVISEILNTVNIADFISQYVQLKQTGKNYVGLCPFHSEKTPSFSVSPDKNLFYCFGCGEGGNIFTFLMKYENLTFPEAVKTIAKHYGIRIPEEHSSPAMRARENEREEILRLNKAAAVYFHGLLQKSQSGKNALDYLKNRGILDSVINDYYLGFAPDGWDNLKSYLLKKGFSEKTAEKAGLIIPRKSGSGFYDRFRSRVIFPISDLRGEVIGFGGRILGEGNPKYLNSPETPVYNKSRSLYGLKQAALHCRKENRVYIVEGYIDVIALYKAGIKNCVASLGTALTQSHVRMLKGYAEKMVLVYDGDEAGIKAAVRSVDIFANEEVDVSILVLPEGMDPDDYINKNGGDKFRELAENASGGVDFITKTWLGKYGDSIEGKVKTISAVEPVLKNIKDPVTKALYVSKVSKILQIPENAIYERIDSSRGRFSTPVRQETKPPVKNIGISKIEASILTALLDLPELAEEIKKNKILNFVDNRVLKETLEKILNKEKTSKPLSLNDIAPEIQPLVAKYGIEQGTWNLRQGKILLKQYLYTKKRKGLMG